MISIGKVQLGKQGITDNFISTLREHFKKNKIVKVAVLKGAGHDKQKVKEFSEEIVNKLGKNFTARIVGFTIAIKIWRKDVWV